VKEAILGQPRLARGLTLKDLALARFREYQRLSRPLSMLYNLIAHRETALFLYVFGVPPRANGTISGADGDSGTGAKEELRSSTASSKISPPPSVPVEEREIPRKWAFEMFSEERLPVALGWSPPDEPIGFVYTQRIALLMALEVDRLEKSE